MYLPYILLVFLLTAFSAFFAVLAHRKSKILVPAEPNFVSESTTIFLPCNGRYDQLRQNESWMRVLDLLVLKEVVFIVESVVDPAYAHICSFLSEIGLDPSKKTQKYD